MIVTLAKLFENTVLSKRITVTVQRFGFLDVIQDLYSITKAYAPKTLELFSLNL